MKISVSIERGPLSFSIEAEDDEEYTQEILNVVEFLEDNEERIENLASNAIDISHESASKVGTVETTDETTDNPLGSFAADVGVNVNNLEETVYIDPGKEELPFLVINDAGIIGDTLPERQRNAALIILYVWEEFYGNDAMDTSHLGESIDSSDISTTNKYKLWNDEGRRYFEHEGSTIKLRGPGRRKAREEIERIVENT